MTCSIFLHISKIKEKNGTCHLLGLLSPGGVHSHQNHIVEICKILESKNIQDESIIVLLQPTSPIRPKKSLDKILEKFFNENFDSMLTLSPIHPLTWKINDKPECMYDYLNRPRRQDFLDEDLIYDENGSVYVFNVKIFNKSINRLGGNIGFYIFDEEYGKQIDTPLDFKVLEAIGNYLNEADDE